MFKTKIWIIILISLVTINCQQLCIGNSLTRKAVCYNIDPSSSDEVLEAVAQVLMNNQALFIPTNEEIEKMQYHVAKVGDAQESKFGIFSSSVVAFASAQVLNAQEMKESHHPWNQFNQEYLFQNVAEVLGANLIDTLPVIHAQKDSTTF